MKALYSILIATILFLSCEKKDDTPVIAKTTSTTIHDTSTGAIRIIDTETYMGYYFDTAYTGYPNLFIDYEPSCIFYIIHSAPDQFVLLKQVYISFGLSPYEDTLVSIDDTFTTNSTHHYLSNRQRNMAVNNDSRTGRFSTIQPGYDTVLTGDTLQFKWSYYCTFWCDGQSMMHNCNFLGIKQK